MSRDLWWIRSLWVGRAGVVVGGLGGGRVGVIGLDEMRRDIDPMS